MSFKDVLVHVDHDPASAARCALAAALCAEWRAMLTGAYLQAPYPRDVFEAERLAYLPQVMAKALKAAHDRSAEQSAQSARQHLARATQTAAIAFDWRKIITDGDADFIRHARCSDLTIVPPRTLVWLGGQARDASRLGLACGGPILVVPEVSHWIAPPRRIMIGWKDAREAARAFRDVRPFLAGAEEVTIVMVQTTPDPAAEARLLRSLAYDRCRARVVVERCEELSAAEALRRQALALGADLVVLGLYGRSRLSELVLGGVSRAFLQDPPAPLLVSH